MSNSDDVLSAEMRFFKALIAADDTTLQDLLTDDFTIVDIIAGNVVPKTPFIEFVLAKAVEFRKIDRVESDVRFYENAAVVVGRTEMAGLFQNHPFQVSSRYTHVFISKDAKWKLAAAQGTQIKTSMSE